MYYHDELITGLIPKASIIRRRVKENMNVYGLGLADAFDEAARMYARKKSSELYKAWYYSDFRKYIPSAYLPEYLDFEKYPLKY